MNDRDSTPTEPQSHRDEQAFGIEVSEVQHFITSDTVFIWYGDKTNHVEVIRRLDVIGNPIIVLTDSSHRIADIPALIAALRRAREIAEQWAAESEGTS